MVRGAKRYAAARNTSVSRLVERYLDFLSRPPRSDDQTPVLRLIRGACDALVTRDPDGYPNPPLPVIDPAAALSWLTEG